MAEPMQTEDDDGVFTEVVGVDDGPAPMQVEDDGAAGTASDIVTQTSLDLEAYCSNYKGRTKVTRLEFIAERCPQLRLEALRLCHDELKDSPDVNAFVALTSKLNEECVAQGQQPLPPVDSARIESVTHKATQQREKLEQDLKSYRRNMVKESIRIGHNELGLHYYNCGDLQQALKCYSRARDYCTSSKQVVEMCANVIKVSVEMGNWGHVRSYIAKAESAPEIAPEAMCMLKACAGLAHLADGQFDAAAKAFLDVPVEHAGSFPSLFSIRDIGIYGALCALATFQRDDLKHRVMQNSAFRQVLEHVPAMREAVKDFYSSRYTTCLKTLDDFRSELLLDIHLYPHVAALFKEIRNKALMQYFYPFLSVDMNRMAEAFSTTVQELEVELIALIMDGQIQARIDTDKKILCARRRDQRTHMFSKALEAGKTFETNAQAVLLRIAMQKAGFLVSIKGSAQALGDNNAAPTTAAATKG